LFALFTVQSPLPNAGADSLRRRKAKRRPLARLAGPGHAPVRRPITRLTDWSLALRHAHDRATSTWAWWYGAAPPHLTCCCPKSQAMEWNKCNQSKATAQLPMNFACGILISKHSNRRMHVSILPEYELWNASVHFKERDISKLSKLIGS
jgi:hypothetical protein